MCLAIPAQITLLDAGGKAMASVGGVEKEISVVLLDDVKVGDFVIVHVGFALSKLDEEEALKTLKLFEEMSEFI